MTEAPSPRARHKPPMCGCQERTECSWAGFPAPYTYVIYTDKGDLFVNQVYEDGSHEISAFLAPVVAKIREALNAKV